jgi:predicted histone-like DNA-binding protein
MAINYSVVAMKDPRDPESVVKYYAKAQAAGVIDINELAEDIAYSTTLTDGDVLNVIRALVKQINKHIAKGEIVRLENLGTFQAQLSSKGAPTEDKFDESFVRKIRLQFRPGLGLQQILSLNNLSFHKVPGLKKKPEKEIL